MSLICDLSGKIIYPGLVDENEDAQGSPLEYAIWEQLASERGPRRKELTNDELARRSGIKKSKVVRLFSPDFIQVRGITVPHVEALAPVFGLTAAELVRRAEERLPVSDVGDDLSERRRKQAEAAAMTPEELDAYAGPKAATRDPEMDTDEPEHP